MAASRGRPVDGLTSMLLLLAALASSVIRCDAQSVSISPSAQQLLVLPHTTGVTYSAQWLNVTCTANDFIHGMVNWTRGGNAISEGPGHIIDDNRLAFRVHHLHPTPTTIECSVGDDSTGDIYTASVDFTSVEKPPTPTVDVGSVTASSAKLLVNSTRLSAADELSYSVVGGIVARQTVTVPFTTASTLVELSGLEPDTQYTVQLTYRNSALNLAGDAHSAVVRTENVPVAPVISGASGVLHNFATVTWEALRESDWNDNAASADMRKYYVVVRGGGAVVLENEHDALSSPTVQLSGLMPSTVYNVRLRAGSQFGNGSAASYDFTTLSTPQITAVNFVTETSTDATSFNYNINVNRPVGWDAPTPFEVKFHYSVDGNKTFSDNVSTDLSLQLVIGGNRYVYVKAIPRVESVLYPEFAREGTILTANRQPVNPIFRVTPFQNSFTINWDPLVLNAPEDQIRSFKVIVYKVGGGFQKEEDPGFQVQQINIPGVAPATEYRVMLTIDGAFGPTAKTEMTATTLSAVPGDVTLAQAEVNSTTFGVTWSLPAWNSLTPGYFTLSWMASAGGPRSDKNFTDGSRSYLIPGLDAHTSYSISLTAFNDIGSSNTAMLTNWTSQAAPTSPLLKPLSQADLNYSVLRVEWDPPVTPNGVIQSYRVDIRGGSDQQNQTTNGTTTMTTFTGLRGCTQYNVQVWARTVDESNPASNGLRTLPGVPSDPPKLDSVAKHIGAIVTLTWRNPMDRQGRLTQYEVTSHNLETGQENITTFNVGGAQGDNCRMDAPWSVSRNVSGLEPETRYGFTVRVSTVAGFSPNSTRRDVTTEPGYPLEPRNLTVIEKTATEVKLQWLPPLETFAKRDSIEYIIRVNGARQVASSTNTGDDEIVDTVLKLKPFTNYLISVNSRTSFESLLSANVSVMTAAAAPSQPQKSPFTCPDSRELVWAEPEQKNGPQLLYEARIAAIGEVGDEFLNSAASSPSNDLSWTFAKRLQPFTRYNVSVRAVQASDDSLAAPLLVFEVHCAPADRPPRQPETIPSVPEGISIYSNGSVPIVLHPSPDKFAAYYLVVVRRTAIGGSRQARSIMGRFRREASSDDYRTANLTSVSPAQPFVVGDGKKYGDFENSPLTQGYSYRFGVQAVNARGDKTAPVFSEPILFEMPSVDESNLTLIIAGVAGGVVVLILVVLLIVVLVRYKRIQPVPSESSAPPLESSKKEPFDPHPPLPPFIVSPTNGDPIKDLRATGSKALEAHPAVPLAEFSDHVLTLRQEGNAGFKDEYESIPLSYEGFTTNNSDFGVNRLKNRYTNIKAFDHSRVRLNAIRGVAGSDYINANFVDGHNEKNAYIATQGPVEETLGDYWRMVWEQQSATIIMLTNLEENGKPKCTQYWPDSGTVTYGSVEVTLTDTVELADYVVRVFDIIKVGQDKQPRQVKQFQFTAWPDQSAPRHSMPMLLFRRKVRQLTPERSGPMIVHCSAGIGRTGTFIAIDAMLKRAEETDDLDVYGYCTVMRTQRNYMVQVEEQYVFIHEALKDSLECGNTEIFAKDLPQALLRLKQPSILDARTTGLAAEYQRLGEQRLDDISFLAALRDCNQKKNRFLQNRYLPYDEYRVRLPLSSMKGEEGGDYVNASYVHGYKSHNAFVAAQSPMDRTVDAFWQMVWQCGSKVVVMLTDTVERGQDTCTQYWPTEMASQYGTCLVDPISEQTKTDSSEQIVYTLRQFKMTNTADDAARTVCLFQYTGDNCWPENEEYLNDDVANRLAPGRRSLIDLIGEVQKLQERTDDCSPVVVHCNTGVGRTGCFIALSTIIERMRCENLLDVFMTVKSLRSHRPFMVHTLAEYAFVYDTVLEYLIPFDHFTHLEPDGEPAAHSRYSLDVAV